MRDILQDATPDRRAETLGLLHRFFGLVLVHGDPGLAALADSFPEAPRIAGLVRYTGLVGPRHEGSLHGPLPPADEEAHDVIVSVGGGAVGARLLAAALAARPLTRLAGARWLVLAGPNGAERQAAAEPGVTLRAFVPDLATRLSRATVSVSQAGYNTVADLLAARCRAVLVPFAAGGETEQARRAALLAARGLAVVVEEAALDAATLAAAIDAACAMPAPDAGLTLDGADETRRIVQRRLNMA